jgi:hypothetical protein
MVCQCCLGQKDRLVSVRSVLIPGVSVLLCARCSSGGHEPRHNVILASFSARDVSAFVVGGLYCGDVLRADEVIHGS